jgi:hypothetical protein
VSSPGGRRRGDRLLLGGDQERADVVRRDRARGQHPRHRGVVIASRGRDRGAAQVQGRRGLGHRDLRRQAREGLGLGDSILAPRGDQGRAQERAGAGGAVDLGGREGVGRSIEVLEDQGVEPAEVLVERRGQRRLTGGARRQRLRRGDAGHGVAAGRGQAERGQRGLGAGHRARRASAVGADVGLGGVVELAGADPGLGPGQGRRAAVVGGQLEGADHGAVIADRSRGADRAGPTVDVVGRALEELRGTPPARRADAPSRSS